MLTLPPTKRVIAFALAAAVVGVAGALNAEESSYATGGTVTSWDTTDGYRVYLHTFTNTDEVASFRNVGNRDLTLRYLVVGAGGSGGYGAGKVKKQVASGGGGGGGVFETEGVSFAVGSEWKILVEPAGTGPAEPAGTGPAKSAGTDPANVRCR